MYKILRSGSWILPAFLILSVASLAGLSGCKPCPPGLPPIDLNKIKPHLITVAEASKMTSDFRAVTDRLDSTCPGFKEKLQLGYAEAFNSDSYQLLLGQTDSAGNLAAGIRIYYGLKDGQMKLIMVPYDSNGNDIIHHLISIDQKPIPGAKTESLTTGDAQALEMGQRCPTICSPIGPLGPATP